MKQRGCSLTIDKSEKVDTPCKKGVFAGVVLLPCGQQRNYMQLRRS